MTTEAFIMMACAWGVIIFFTVKFFVKVLKTPEKEE
jgi:hypothetical protein